MVEPIDHVRRPDLPWRVATLTECGLAVADVTTISRDEFVARVKQQGQQRSAMTTCMTCWSTANRWPTWKQDPVQAMAREVVGYSSSGKHEQIRRELYALAALVAEHRDDFEAYLSGLAATVSLDAARTRRRTVR